MARAEGVSIEDRLDDIARRFGRHVTVELSVRREPDAALAAVDRMRREPPVEIGGRRVRSVEFRPEASLLRLWVDGSNDAPIRLQVRPSGTEPKVKLYGEAVDEDPSPLLAELATRV